MIVAQLTERSLPIPEVRGLNRVKNLCKTRLTVNCWKDEYNEKRPKMTHFENWQSIKKTLIVIVTFMPKNVSNQNLFCECNLGRRREEVTTGDYKITAAVNLHWIFHELHVDGNLPFSAYVGRYLVGFIEQNSPTCGNKMQ